jgi:UDP-glucose 4-epimerase
VTKEVVPVKLAVTGASGYIGKRLVQALCDDDRVERVLGFDIVPSSFAHPKLVFDSIDVRDPSLEARLAGIDALVHLAFIMDPIKNASEMREVNVNGSQNIFMCAGKAGVRKIVYSSSATVYGAHPDNDRPLTEESPLRANLDFSYAAHKLEVEYVLKEFREEFPDVSMTVLRPAIVFGPNVDNAWAHMLELPVMFSVQDHAAPLQFVHEDDVARALHKVAIEDAPGIYNLAAPGGLEVDEMLSLLGRRRIELSEPVAFSMMDRMWSMGLVEAPAGMLHYVMYPWVVSTDKLAEAGFEAMYSNRETFAEVAERARSYVRFGQRRVRRGDLARGATAGLGLLGTAAALRVARRRRSDV